MARTGGLQRSYLGIRRNADRCSCPRHHRDRKAVNIGMHGGDETLNIVVQRAYVFAHCIYPTGPHPPVLPNFG